MSKGLIINSKNFGKFTEVIKENFKDCLIMDRDNMLLVFGDKLGQKNSLIFLKNEDTIILDIKSEKNEDNLMDFIKTMCKTNNFNYTEKKLENI